MAQDNHGHFSSEMSIISKDSIIVEREPALQANSAERVEWGGKVEYILTCVSYAVGLGNVWRFPYLAYENGGGAFLVPYILTLLVVGVPLFFMELSWGQFASSGPVTIWTVNPMFKGVGIASIVVVTYITLYFNVILAWCFHYLFASMQETLPWINCNNTWNTPNCREIGSVNQSEPEEIKNTYTTPTEEYYYNKVLGLSSSIDEFGSIRPDLAGYLLLSWTIVFLVLIKGISSLGKVSYVVSILPYIVLTILLIRASTLEGAIDGIEYYIVPRFEELGELKVWTQGATQIFYSVGVCLGCLPTMGSYNKFKNNTLWDSLLVPPINCLTSIYSGFVIFAVLGYMAHVQGVGLDKVAADGPGLVFVVYPEALATMPIPQLWSVLFFVMLCLIGFGSIFSQAEAAITAMLDQFPSTLRVGRRPILLRLAFCTIGYLITLPMVFEGGFYLFKIVNDYSAGYQLLVIGICEVFVLMAAYGLNRFSEDIEMMLGRQPPLYFKFCWCFATPLLCFAVLIAMMMNETGTLSHNGVPFPRWTISIAWLLVLFPISIILFYAIGRFLKDGGWKALKSASAPRRSWGPADPENRTGRYAPQQNVPAIEPQANGTTGPYMSGTMASSGDIRARARPPSYNEHYDEITSSRF